MARALTANPIAVPVQTLTFPTRMRYTTAPNFSAPNTGVVKNPGFGGHVDSFDSRTRWLPLSPRTRIATECAAFWYEDISSGLEESCRWTQISVPQLTARWWPLVVLARYPAGGLLYACGSLGAVIGRMA